MNDASSLTMAAALVGTITGTAGLVLGILNYLRDRPNVVVSLVWDLHRTDADGAWGVLKVANIGRRPIFVSHASLNVPGSTEYILLGEGVAGVKLLESDPPTQYVISQTGLEKYVTQWRELRGCVVDITGKQWWSAPVKERPSWAEPKLPPS